MNSTLLVRNQVFLLFVRTRDPCRPQTTKAISYPATPTCDVILVVFHKFFHFQHHHLHLSFTFHPAYVSEQFKLCLLFGYRLQCCSAVSVSLVADLFLERTSRKKTVKSTGILKTVWNSSELYQNEISAQGDHSSWRVMESHRI